MVIYNSITKKILFYFSILLTIIVLTHMIVALIISNTMTYSTIVMYTLVPLSLVIIVCLLLFLKLTTNHTNKLYKYLLHECDPKKALELIEQYEVDATTKKTKLALSSIKFMILFRLGMYQESLDEININMERETNNPIILIMWYHNNVMASIALNKIDVEEKLEHFKNLIKRFPKKSDLILDYATAQEKFYYLTHFRYEGLDTYYERELEYCSTLSEKVSYNANLAKIYYSFNEIEKAKNNIEFVLKNGNTMKVVGECEQLKSKIGE